MSYQNLKILWNGDIVAYQFKDTQNFLRYHAPTSYALLLWPYTCLFIFMITLVTWEEVAFKSEQEADTLLLELSPSEGSAGKACLCFLELHS